MVGQDLVQGGLVLGEDERKALAKAVVDVAINIYTIGMMKQKGAPVETISRWVPGLASFWPSLETSKLSWEERHHATAKLLYEVGLRLGGLPFKAMQFVGLRDDLPDGYRKWFSKAQENTEFFSPPEHVQRVLGAFGPSLHWSYEPKKSASIAQVHLKATWSGWPAVAKVQHAHVRAEYTGDLKTMAELGAYVNEYEEAKGAAVMLAALAEKLAPTVEMETDFTKEAANQERVRELFRRHGTDVAVAQVYMSSPEGLVMQKLEGITAAEAIAGWKQGGGAQNDLFGRKQRDSVYSAFADMVLNHGFFQMDAHPGNLMVLKDGRLALLDFGQCCEPTEEQRRRFLHFAHEAPTSQEAAKDTKKLKSWLANMGIEVTEQKAAATAELLFYGAKSSMFPDTDKIDPEIMPLLLIVLYLSRFENTVAQLRVQAGFQDAEDHFAVLRAFNKAAGAGGEVHMDL
ncbi:ABC1K8 [Symbiodinium sp. CCMP2592]|nr:ABC1K8 [Symbiodinium sp. CCMP2592]